MGGAGGSASGLDGWGQQETRWRGEGRRRVSRLQGPSDLVLSVGCNHEAGDGDREWGGRDSKVRRQ